MQLAFYFDQTRCVGCYTCCVACKDWHDISPGPVHWRRVTCMEEGEFPQVFVAYLSTSCHHCENPACAEACPVDAITKREEDGIVVVDRESCMGESGCGGLCREACPLRALDAGPMEELKKKYAGARQAAGFMFAADVRPCILFKPKEMISLRNHGFFH